MARIERATSPLPRECSTTEPHGHRHRPGNPGTQTCADDNQPLPSSRPAGLERETGIEPAPSAWKAEVLPLNYTRLPDTAPATPEGASHAGPRPAEWWRGLDSNQRSLRVRFTV